jgi:hypothetical protein
MSPPKACAVAFLGALGLSCLLLAPALLIGDPEVAFRAVLLGVLMLAGAAIPVLRRL